MANISDFETDLASILSDSKFLTGLQNNFLGKVSDKKGFFKENLTCIFVKPQGVRKLEHAGKCGISNREYQAFSLNLINYLDKNHKSEMDSMRANSPLQAAYGDIWPNCSDKITDSILKLKPKIEKQKEIQEILGRNVAPTSGQPTKSS